jgi:hypothetical protein
MARASRRLRLSLVAVAGAAAACILLAVWLTRDQAARAPDRYVLTLQASAFPRSYREAPSIEATQAPTYDGDAAVHASIPGGARRINKYARAVVHPIDWGAGTDVWYGCAVYLPHGFYADQQGQVDLMRWDNFDLDRATTDRGGVVVYGAPEAGSAYLMRARLGGDQDELVGPFTLSEGVWHWLEVHQRYTVDNNSDVSELFLDGRLVGRSGAPNWYGRRITAVRFGIVATAPTQGRRLELWLDRARIGPRRIGPLPSDS